MRPRRATCRPADQPYLPAGTFIPVGTQVTLKFKTNKPLRAGRDRAVGRQDQRTTIDIPATAADRQSFAYRIDALKGSADARNLAARRRQRRRPSGRSACF